MSKDFLEQIRCYGGLSLEYSALTEADFTATAGAAYSPPERGNFRRNNVTRCLQLLADCTGVVETFQTSAAEVRLPANTITDATNDAGNGRLFFFKNTGTGTITIKDYLGTTLWLSKQYSIVIITGNDNNNWDFYFTAKNINFDNSSNGYVADNVQDSTVESRSKSGIVAAGSFSGNPKKYTVVFAQNFPDTNYSVAIIGIDKRSWSIESPTISGFVIDTGANQALTADVGWTATKNWS